MVKKQKTQSSILRVFHQFKDIPIETIALIQTLYIDRDWKAIKKSLNNTKIKKPTALAYGRLSSQYINLLNSPTNIDKGYVKTKFKISLTSDYDRNLILSGNKRGHIGPPPKINFQDLIRLDGLLGTFANGNIITEILNPDVNIFLNNLNNLHRFVPLINRNKITHYRIYAEFNTLSDNHVFMSTSILQIPNFEIIENFLRNAEAFVESAALYDYEDLVETLTELISIVVEYM